LPGEDGSTGRFVVVAGEAGMGKTRLIAEFAEIAKGRGKRVLWSQMIEDPGAPPYFPWLLALRSCVQQSDDESLLADLGSGAADVADIVPELRERIALDHSRTASGSVAARYQLFDSVTRFLHRTAARQPLVLLFDNLHAADRSSLALLEYYCQQIAGTSVLVVAAYRESELSRRHPLRPVLNQLARSAGFLRLALAGLSRTEVAELLHSQIGYPLSAPLVAAVHEQSDGNPLFVTEVGSMLARRKPNAQLTAAGFHFKVPESLREVIGARLDALPAETCNLLGIAAVLGREFDLRILVKLAALRTERVVKLLHHAEAAGVVTALTPGRFRFHHALFREVLYAEHSTIARVSLHRKAGEQLEARYRDDPGSHISELAYHFFEAAQAGREDKAIRYCRQAAESAVGQRAYGEAVSLLGCALQAAEFEENTNQERRFAILRAMGRAQYQSGQLNAATHTLMKAAILAYRRRWWERLADALFQFQLVCQQSGYHHVASVPLHNAVLEQLPEKNDVLRARTLASLAKAHRTAGRPDHAVETFRQSIALARECNDPGVLLDCLRKGNWIVGRSPMNVREGLEISREALALAKAEGNVEAVLDSVVDMAFQLGDLGEISELQQQLVVLRQLATEERQPHFQNVLIGFETAVAILQGRWADAIRGAKEGVRSLPLQGVLGLQGRFAFQIFAIKKAQGTLGQVQDVAERILSASSDAELWLPGRILLHCELGQRKQACEALQNLGDPREHPRDDLLEIALVYLAEACARLTDVPRCTELYDLLTPYRGLNATLPGTVMLGAVSGYLASLAMVMRRHDEARELFEEALLMNASMGAAPALARTRVDFARLLLGTGYEQDRVQARRLLAKARPIVQELELRPVLHAMDDFGTEPGVVSLTGREIDVLKIVATGSSNNRIADALNISHSTVATHIRSIFRKVGVANRTEAADFARRAGLLDQD
jgi:DNA-binding CsgD family transcriptional regulator/tetratricopeptide (TPR) repeat protein